jgi:transposase
LRGKKVVGEVSGKKFERQSIVAAKCGKTILAPFGYTGTCDSKLFNFWIENILLPELKKGQFVIMDNATIHKSEKTQKLIESAGCKLLFLPPYSPDLNPIEHFWAKFKQKVRNTIGNHNSLADTMQYALFN